MTVEETARYMFLSTFGDMDEWRRDEGLRQFFCCLAQQRIKRERSVPVTMEDIRG